MKLTRLLILVFLAGTGALRAGTPAGKTQLFTSPDQVPEGLAKSDWSSIRAAYEAGRHAFQPVPGKEGVWQARNPRQQWTTTFDQRGFVVQPKGGGWSWGLELRSYGFGEKQTPVGSPTVKAEGQCLSYQWDAAVEEWFVNDTRGLEHGFTAKQRPARSDQSERSHLGFTLNTRGTLHPTITADAQGVLFQDAVGVTVLNYTGLKVWDADGNTLPSRFEPAGENRIRLLVDDSGARYPLTIDPIAQQAYLKPAAVGTTQAEDYFGSSVAISGDTVVVGAPEEASSTTGVNSSPNESAGGAGAAYVFVRNGSEWTQQAYLKPAAVGTTQRWDRFGASVAVSGDTVIVGAPGEDSSTTGVNSTPDELAECAGAAYVFVRSGTTWTEQAYVKPAAVGTSHSGDFFGSSVAVSGDTMVVGASNENSSTTGVDSTHDESAREAGAAYVFMRSGTMWTQQAYLKPAAVGTSQAEDLFGSSVAVSGDTVVVGAFEEASSTTGVNSTANEGADDAGAAFIFTGLGPLTGYDAWTATNIPAGQDAAFDGDWNHDGILNGVEYVFGTTRLNPTGKAKVPAPPSIPADVDVFLDRSTDLSNSPDWAPVASWVNGAAPTFASGVTLVSGEVRDTFAGPKAYYRYRVVLR